MFSQQAALILTTISLPIGSVVVTTSNMLGHVMIVERTMATCWARTYEQYRGGWFSVGWILFDCLPTGEETNWRGVLASWHFWGCYLASPRATWRVPPEYLLASGLIHLPLGEHPCHLASTPRIYIRVCCPTLSREYNKKGNSFC